MAKFKVKPLVNFHDNEKYVFKAGVAKVPGTNMTITLKEFNEMKKEYQEADNDRKSKHVLRNM